ncbi:hypothetical protein KC19_7G014200 [Ceratodon purpureus]|uniref:Uncharacterized protein n=1 Tax=Ceratodon purpureus TaxID=3225 RepID=A0A8T0H0Z7_CERPU|nr:hypothetical protein KC19_7G014200 [Ceratodon purpureus]
MNSPCVRMFQQFSVTAAQERESGQGQETARTQPTQSRPESHANKRSLHKKRNPENKLNLNSTQLAKPRQTWHTQHLERASQVQYSNVELENPELRTNSRCSGQGHSHCAHEHSKTSKRGKSCATLSEFVATGVISLRNMVGECGRAAPTWD